MSDNASVPGSRKELLDAYTAEAVELMLRREALAQARREVDGQRARVREQEQATAEAARRLGSDPLQVLRNVRWTGHTRQPRQPEGQEELAAAEA